MVEAVGASDKEVGFADGIPGVAIQVELAAVLQDDTVSLSSMGLTCQSLIKTSVPMSGNAWAVQEHSSLNNAIALEDLDGPLINR